MLTLVADRVLAKASFIIESTSRVRQNQRGKNFIYFIFLPITSFSHIYKFYLQIFILHVHYRIILGWFCRY